MQFVRYLMEMGGVSSNTNTVTEPQTKQTPCAQYQFTNTPPKPTEYTRANNQNDHNYHDSVSVDRPSKPPKPHSKTSRVESISNNLTRNPNQYDIHLNNSVNITRNSSTNSSLIYNKQTNKEQNQYDNYHDQPRNRQSYLLSKNRPKEISKSNKIQSHQTQIPDSHTSQNDTNIMETIKETENSDKKLMHNDKPIIAGTNTTQSKRQPNKQLFNSRKHYYNYNNQYHDYNNDYKHNEYDYHNEYGEEHGEEYGNEYGTEYNNEYNDDNNEDYNEYGDNWNNDEYGGNEYGDEYSEYIDDNNHEFYKSDKYENDCEYNDYDHGYGYEEYDNTGNYYNENYYNYNNFNRRYTRNDNDYKNAIDALDALDAADVMAENDNNDNNNIDNIDNIDEMDDQLPETQIINDQDESPLAKLYRILNEILLEIIQRHYIPDFVLIEKIEDKLIQNSLLPINNNSNPHEHHRNHPKLINLKKYQNGAWELKILHGQLRNTNACFGLLIKIDDTLSSHIRETVFRRIKRCPKLVRDFIKLNNRNRNRNRNNNNDNIDNSDSDSDSESLQSNGNNNNNEKQYFGICEICKQEARPTLRFGKHICRVKSTYRCRCGKQWASHIALLDPKTLYPPPGVKSYCSMCKTNGRFIKFSLTKRIKKKDDEESKHRSDLCSVCIKWGDCRGLFIQMATLKKAFSLMDDCKNEQLEFIKDEDEDGQISFAAQYTEQNEQVRFWIKPYVNIL